MIFFSDKFFYEVSHRLLFCCQIIACLSRFNYPTCYHFQSSVESITKLSIFCDVCLRDSNCLSSFQKRFVVCCLAVSSLMTNLNNESIPEKKRHQCISKRFFKKPGLLTVKTRIRVIIKFKLIRKIMRGKLWCVPIIINLLLSLFIIFFFFLITFVICFGFGFYTRT